MTDSTLTSWGRFPPFLQTAHPCYWRGNLADNLSRLAQSYGSVLPYGNGRSYGDSCLASSGHVLHMRFLDRLIAADWQSGVVVAESGTTLEELLTLSIPNGWFLPVTPGTKFVTLGGALANDVHGKNHHVRGTFGRHVSRFGLIRSDRTPLVCSPEENTELFAATIGGLGLTGIIEWMELKLIPISSSQIDATYIRFGSLNEFFALSTEFDGQHEYTVAWIDCLAKERSAGRGVFMVGDHAAKGGLVLDNKSKLSVPITPPFSVINHLTLWLFNNLYYHAHRAGQHRATVSYEPFFYPLDRILSWNRIYGSRGFQQYQCVIPNSTAEASMHELLATIAAAGSGSFLAVMKRCGDVVSPGLLSFPMPGVSLALDFSQHEELNRRLFPRLDAIVRESGGRLYPAKDAHMSGSDFRTFYPAWKHVEALRDPALRSRFWSRVTQS